MKFEIYEIIDGMEIYRGYRESKEEAEFVKVSKEAAGHDVKIVEFDAAANVPCSLPYGKPFKL